MRRVILAGALLLAVAACGGEETPAEDVEVGTGPTGQDSPGTGQDDPDQGGDQDAGEAGEGTFVLNRYGDETGFPDQRPTDYVATEFTTFRDMEWDEWADTEARGEGEVSGTWCLDEDCSRDPYDIEIALGDPVEVDGTAYFSTYTVTEYDDDMPERMREALESSDEGRLDVPVAE
ncbi:hypothetical protein DFP74_3154 [Nocardiopsis sp. Huas11]|uniref:hypothetical protein n=1 Tax=Nocardiopsis sp. Huas11 TaxID=2183912 RepID=UPI000F0D9C9A|nr:hypothetical protein [Nocardiopsis sp. Huas11]RKS07482.1 hypothetical protein DFP74_3154 [Nocardiopsis sp. Huas11]